MKKKVKKVRKLLAKRDTQRIELSMRPYSCPLRLGLIVVIWKSKVARKEGRSIGDKVKKAVDVKAGREGVCNLFAGIRVLRRWLRGSGRFWCCCKAVENKR